MSESFNLPGWEERMPGEQWVMLDTVATADTYLSSYGDEAVIHRESWPNPDGLYARISFPGRIPQYRIYIPIVAEEF
jgi:hypothetical protein